ncbi:hypothetical protein T265_12212 [Opisthorchis viverrini]|uniref:Uncharacterized protein n=1 Tax=Opisthorchis viverrini TaxID=6198 RepID=A0A074ZTR7_OPIVI|nr:hypothetical protein T265_12212 [Opisthorchis viverrini]KER18624.1 hypothetical protein T265_12212 [Opisthorchis viverrini]
MNPCATDNFTVVVYDERKVPVIRATTTNSVMTRTQLPTCVNLTVGVSGTFRLGADPEVLGNERLLPTVI